MAQYLVTGAAGFIGGAVAKRLAEQGHNVVTIDNLSTGYKEAVPEGVELIVGNCQDNDTIAKLNNRKFDAIYHIAGQSSGEISFDDPIYDLQTNAQSTLLLLKYALATGCKNIIYASTMSVYGNQPDEPIAEDYTTFPKSFYAVGKLASENYLRIYNEQYGLNTIALRLYNVYGPGQNLKNLRQGMVSIFLALAMNEKHILVKGSPDRFRDQVYIDDVVDAFLAAEKNAKNYECLNVCTGRKTYVKDVVETIQKSLPYEVTVEYAGSTPGDQFGIYGDPTAIEKTLDWKANYTFDEGMKKMIDWAFEQ